MSAHPADSPARSRPLPARIGRYDVTSRLGVGAMGVVYGARDSAIDRDVAIKVMNAEVEENTDVRARFVREARIGGQLLHRNVTTVLDMGEDRGRPFIVMELLQGQPLTEFLGGKPVALETKLDLMSQLCEGLSAAHAHDVIHRDIKPSNLFVQDDGTLKILDFGVSRLMGSTMTAAGFLVGTPEFMAPEQATAQALDARADLFSSSAVFYYMLSGRSPFAGRDLVDVLRRVQREDPPPLSDAEAPPLLSEVVMRGLAKNRDERLASMAAMQAALTGFRRHWEAETRREGRRAQQTFESLSAAMAENAALEAALGLTPSGEGRAGLEALRDRYPLIADLGGEAFIRIPFRRDQVLDVIRELKLLEAGVRTRVLQLEERQRVAVARAEADEAAREAARARLAAEHAAAAEADRVRRAAEREATELAAAAAEAARVAEAARRAAEREAAEHAARAAAEEAAREARRLQALAHLDAARQACEVSAWAVACTEAERALELEAAWPEALACLAQARCGQVREAAVQFDASRHGRLLADARQLLASRRFGAAARLAERAAALVPDSEAARDLALEAMQTRSASLIAGERERLAAERARAAARQCGVARRALARGDVATARRAAEAAIVNDPEFEAAQALLRESFNPSLAAPGQGAGWRRRVRDVVDTVWLRAGGFLDHIRAAWGRIRIRLGNM